MQAHELSSRIREFIGTVLQTKPTCRVTISVFIKDGGIADYHENIEGKNILDILKNNLTFPK